MANKKEVEKRPVGRPPGREFTHIARTPMRKETWQAFSDLAAAQGRSAADIVRELVDRYVKRHSR